MSATSAIDAKNQDNNDKDNTNDWGAFAGEVLKNFVSIILFTIIGSNLTDNKCEYFNYINTPDLEVWKAIRISCNIPFLYSPFYYRA